MDEFPDENFLIKLGLKKYSLTYCGCPEHQDIQHWGCPLDNKGNCLCKSGTAPYWKINGKSLREFLKSISNISNFVVYVFVEENGKCRKIGEGKVERIRANLKAHYNHGLTKSPHTQNDRKNGNVIAKRVRNYNITELYIKNVKSKQEARNTEEIIKERYYGWLDYDQK